MALRAAIFALLAVQCTFATSVTNFTIRYMCTSENSSLCIGMSFPDPKDDFLNLDGYYLQLKHRYNLIARKEYENAQKHIAWAQFNETALRPFFDPRVGIQMKRKGTLKTIELGVKVTNITFNYTANASSYFVQVPEYGCCLTVMQCEAGSNGFCDPFSAKPVYKKGQVRQGNYISCKPCLGVANYSVSQIFTSNHDCQPTCKDWMLNNDKCDVQCNNTQCFNDLHDCDPGGSRSPTLQPTLVPATVKTPVPASTRAPTAQPTHRLTDTPTPYPTEQPTANTRFPTEQPTAKTPFPTEQPAVKTRYPTGQPAERPSRRPAKGTQTPTSPLVQEFVVESQELDELSRNITEALRKHAEFEEDYITAILSIVVVQFIVIVSVLVALVAYVLAPPSVPPQ